MSVLHLGRTQNSAVTSWAEDAIGLDQKELGALLPCNCTMASPQQMTQTQSQTSLPAFGH